MVLECWNNALGVRELNGALEPFMGSLGAKLSKGSNYCVASGRFHASRKKFIPMFYHSGEEMANDLIGIRPSMKAPWS